MSFRYLSKDILHGYDKYKYNSIDSSPVSKYITHPFWNFCVQFFPRWLAPNVITLSGFMLLVIQYSLFTYYDPYFYASDTSHPEYPPVPSWLWLVAAGCMFWAHTLDGIDGKQARRTGMSGPLGELFDHGLDSWATLFMPIGMYSVFGRGSFSIPPERCFPIILGVMFTFSISHWEKYNTGVLFLPWGYDISQLAMTLVYLNTWIFGYEIYKFSYAGFTVGDAFEFLMHFSVWGFSIPMSLWNVYVSYRDRTGKMYSLWDNIKPLVPIFIEFALFLMWMRYSSYDIIKKQPRLFTTSCGTVFSHITCRLIVNSMANTDCDIFNWLLIPLAAIVIGVLTIPLGIIELYLLWAYTIFVTAAHIHYGICVVQQLAEHLNIYIFTVGRPEKTE
ncbi:hypothetical protein CAPTEDRAFT_184397 [Capitella teleta]|uniref:Ethanolaminephosphotransferase 1 n=1 Tax=Capitella teleta TaxID=283909 RepID=R7VC76_CAPTE|nr:hypothetical protein CAPTEDRAFT_184397 [Capitella teleta]|eukprot:ELU13280.1 hypothetical protein CAPTEDRAFT_184397 [Capitella teleta]